VEEDRALPGHPLEHEALAAKKTSLDLGRERDVEFDAFVAAEERVLAGDELAIRADRDRKDLARHGAGKRDKTGALARREPREEYALAHDRTLDAGDDAAFELALHRERAGHVHHRAGFGIDSLARQKIDLHHLQVAANNLVLHTIPDENF